MRCAQKEKVSVTLDHPESSWPCIQMVLCSFHYGISEQVPGSRKAKIIRFANEVDQPLFGSGKTQPKLWPNPLHRAKDETRTPRDKAVQLETKDLERPIRQNNSKDEEV